MKKIVNDVQTLKNASTQRYSTNSEKKWKMQVFALETVGEVSIEQTPHLGQAGGFGIYGKGNKQNIVNCPK